MAIRFVGDFRPSLGGFGIPFPEDEALVGNAEFAVASTPSPAARKAYAVVAGPEAIAAVARSGFAALNLANNHTYDAGEHAFDRLVRALREETPVQGYGTVDTPHALVESDRLRIAVVGCLERCRSRGPRLFPEEDVESLIESLAPSVDRVFVTPHWGKEGEYCLFPSPRQRLLARRWLRAGAHAVFGHHSHTVQGAERFDGRPVFYSLGNFSFDHAEGSAYAATRFGLSVEFRTAERSGEDSFIPRAFYWRGPEFCWLDSDEVAARAWERAFHDLGDALSAPGEWGYVRWARSVGPIYISKSRAAWKRRIAMSRFRSLPLWLAWSALPSTLLLRLGALFPESSAVAIERKIVEEVVARIAEEGESAEVERSP